MKLRRFKIDKACIQGQEAVIRDLGEIRHIGKVLRLKAGDEVALLNGEGNEYHATITGLSPREISLRLSPNLYRAPAESPLRLILGLGLLKASKFDWFIQKATELGVSAIVPFYSLRVVPRWEEEKYHSRRTRWEKIASEAAKQCGRVKVPLIQSPCSFTEALTLEIGEATKIFLWGKEPSGSLQDALAHPAATIYILVGPEGGFSEKEALQAREAGFRPVRLGPRTLRSETAGIVATGLLQFLLGDLR